jgi:hypothetical protein
MKIILLFGAACAVLCVAVPALATWALMLGGFGLLGSTLRGRGQAGRRIG